MQNRQDGDGHKPTGPQKIALSILDLMRGVVVFCRQSFFHRRHGWRAKKGGILR
jgi:hypothetical protein